MRRLRAFAGWRVSRVAGAGTPLPMKRPDEFRGNKQSLPSKPCAACGRPMTWRRKWAKNWQDVRYCSDACRKMKSR